MHLIGRTVTPVACIRLHADNAQKREKTCPGRPFKRDRRHMFLVPLDKPDDLAPAPSAAKELHAVAGVISAVQQDNFAFSALSALNALLPLSWLSVYSLHADSPPQMHIGGSYRVPDRTFEAFDFYRQGVYLADRTFDDAKEKLQNGEAAITYWHANEIPVEHRKGIYTRNGLQERASLVRKRDDGSLLAINFYRHQAQGSFSDADIDLFCRLGEPLISCVNLQIRLGQGQAQPTLAGPLAALPTREREVCERLLRGWTHEGIATDLGISGGTVKTYRDRAFDRLGIHHRNELFALALAWGTQAAPVQPAAH